MNGIRRAAVAGSWYPGTADALAREVDRHLRSADAETASARSAYGTLRALVAPHAGLEYSGPVAAFAYRLLRGRRYDVAVLVGPSHFIDFEGVAVSTAGGFDTPFGVVPVDRECAAALLATSPVFQEHASPHLREHSLELQLPFLRHLCPQLPIVPLVVGRQTAATTTALAVALARVLGGCEALLIASTDLSHFRDRRTTAALDAIVLECVEACDPDQLQTALDRRPDHACGGGPLVAVMRAARLLGALDGRVERYADSGDVSGDTSNVVGYMAAALGRREGR